MKYKSYRELMYAISQRAKELTNLPIDSLRATYPLVTETRAELIAECKLCGYSRGDMVEAILVEEFDLEFDVNFEGG